MKKIILIIFVALSLSAKAQEAQEETPNANDVRSSVSAAFDSVYLLDTLSLKSSLDSVDINEKIRNTRHLVIMMQKNWFVDGLTENQKRVINNKITN